ncbi:signal peptidase I [Candidatus Micrarchaeota archaeon]|nr:signal peptidase I [Candidatus Micrarchaeota archaeon]
MAVFRRLLLVFAVLAGGYVFLALVLGTPSFLATVTSDSMAPALTRGDWVLLKTESAYDVGDVVVFSRDDSVYVHRVTFVASDGSYRTRGDANVAVDGWIVPHGSVQGTVAFRIPWFGHLALVLGGR